MIDLAPEHRAAVERILKKIVPDCDVFAFGSRVTGTAKKYSDLDIAIVGSTRLPPVIVMRLKEAFEESELPVRVDVLDWHALPESFRKIISETGEKM